MASEDLPPSEWVPERKLEALPGWIKAVENDLLNHCKGLIKPSQCCSTAMDLLQDALLKATRKCVLRFDPAQDGLPPADNFRRWVFTIASRIWIDRRRRAVMPARSTGNLDADTPEPGRQPREIPTPWQSASDGRTAGVMPEPASAEVATFDPDAFRDNLDRLRRATLAQRRAVVLRIVGFSSAEAAELLSSVEGKPVTPNAVDQRTNDYRKTHGGDET